MQAVTSAAAGGAAGVKQPSEQTAQSGSLELDKDFLCPICIQLMNDAFLSSCGHSFCYMCIMTHLQTKNACPCCATRLTPEQLYPNLVLNKVLKRALVSHLSRVASPSEYLRVALKEGTEISRNEIDSLLEFLAEKKKKAEHEELETNMEVLLDFLQKSRCKKRHELLEIGNDLRGLKEDIGAVEQQILELRKTKENGVMTSPVLSFRIRSLPGPTSLNHSGCSKLTEYGKEETSVKIELVSKKRRVASRFQELQDCYLRKRRKAPVSTLEGQSSTSCGGYGSALDEFQSVLASFTRYSRLTVVAEVRQPDLFHSSNTVSSIEFDRDDEFFATAGVSRRIKVFEYSTATSDSVNVPYPVMDISSRSKLSCLSWNKYIKHHIASSDYEGIVTIWDVNNGQSVMEYVEHEERVWSVDFCRSQPSMLISGGDDGKVKVWSMKDERSVLGIDIKANVCCVKYSPTSSNFVAVGSADLNVHFYDLRKHQAPVHTFVGHRKTVSYVSFTSAEELISASTDNTLRIWNTRDNSLIRVFRGHTNEKNFVGLSSNCDFIACGSETNEVYVYHKALPKPAASYKFSECDEEAALHFISAVCWKGDDLTMLAASSEGTIKVLRMAS